MDLNEFVELYISASDEVKILVASALVEFQPQSECSDLPSHNSTTTP